MCSNLPHLRNNDGTLTKSEKEKVNLMNQKLLAIGAETRPDYDNDSFEIRKSQIRAKIKNLQSRNKVRLQSDVNGPTLEANSDKIDFRFSINPEMVR